MTTLVRVRVVPAAGAALDLALPGAVPVADLLPELGRLARLSFAARLVTATGRQLDAASGLAAQSVADGAVLALVPVEVGAPEVDDPAEALAREVATEVLGWHVRLVRPVALAVTVLFLGMGGAALARGPAWSGAVAASGVVLLGGASGLAVRRRHDRLLAAASGWAAVGLAAIAGEQYAGPLAASAAAAATALVLARALGNVGVLLLPAVAAASVLGCLAILARSTELEPGLVAALGLTATALAVPALPRIALGVTRARAGPARELLRAMLAATAVAMVVLAGPAAAAGGAGALLAATVGILVACRGSRHHGAVEVGAGVATGVAIELVAAAVTTLRHPDWAGAVGVACLVAAGAACALALTVTTRDTGSEAASDPRLALAIDRVETLALVALVPLLVGAGGVVPMVTGLIGRSG